MVISLTTIANVFSKFDSVFRGAEVATRIAGLVGKAKQRYKEKDSQSKKKKSSKHQKSNRSKNNVDDNSADKRDFKSVLDDTNIILDGIDHFTAKVEELFIKFKNKFLTKRGFDKVIENLRVFLEHSEPKDRQKVITRLRDVLDEFDSDNHEI